MKKRLTIFHVDGERGLRGGEKQLLYLASALQQLRGHRNIVACRPGTALEKASGEAGLETVSLPFFFEWDPVSALILRVKIKRLLKEGPVVLHAHTGHAASLAWLAAAGKLCP
ncbi:MAG: glycosyltransferase, partial [bacterium]